MTLPSSGPLTLADIQTEFGGSNPISLSEYYAGGAYVPAGTSGTYGAVPSSGTISIRNFYGTKKFTPVTNTYNSGSGTETIPTGASQLVIEVWQGGAGGGGDSYGNVGGGGGAGAYAKKTLSLTSADYGKTFTYSVGAGGAGGTLTGSGGVGGDSTVNNGTYATTVAIAAVSGITASGGGPSTGAGSPGAGGAGGLIAGGDTNTAGGNGSGSTGGTSPNGGYPPGNGGQGGFFSAGQAGAAGRVKFAYT